MKQLTLDTKRILIEQGEGEKSMVIKLIDMAAEQLAKAVNKHPLFPEHLTYEDFELDLPSLLERTRNWCNNPQACVGHDVFHEEYLEFHEAVLNKDREAALKELAQVIQVCLRIGIHLDHYLGLEDHREQADKPVQAPK